MEELEKVLPAHREYLDNYYALGKFLFSGRKNPRTGGIIICSADGKDNIERIIKEDPFYINEIAEYEIVEFISVKCQKGLENYLEE